MSEAASLTEHRLGPLEQVPLGEGRAFRVDGHDIAVFRPRDGAIAATQAACPHRAGPLADGIVGLESVVCPLHARRFSLVTGEGDGDDCSVAVHSVRVDTRGDMFVSLPEPGEG